MEATDVAVLLVGGIVLVELVKYVLARFLKRTVETSYVTTDDCRKCEKHLDDEETIDALRAELRAQKAAEERVKEHLREEIRAMKKVLFIMAEKQGIPATQLQELVR